MDYYTEGRDWMDRWFTPEGYRLHGPYIQTHLRALLRLTDNANDWRAAQRGFYDRLREINDLPPIEYDEFVARMKTVAV